MAGQQPYRFPQKEFGAMARSIARHTRFVVFSKHVLLLLVVMMVAGIVLLPMLGGEDAGIRIAFSSVERTGGAIMPRMVNPRLQGVDSGNHPFLITAEEAVQPSEGRIDLYRLKADLTLEGESWLALTARKAEVDMISKRMALEGDVAIFHDGGYELHTEEAYVSLDEAAAYGDSGVTGQGPAGVLKSGGFRVYDRGGRMSFTNGVRLTIYPGGAG